LKIPEKIEITVSSGGRPLAEMLVMLTFLMERKNHHQCIFGPSDENGRIEVPQEQIRREARKSMELFLMDYADIETYWTGNLRVTPMDRAALARALSAFRRFRGFEFAPGYEQSLQAADAALANIPNAEIVPAAQCESSEPVRIEAVSVRSNG
jgi:hypothetical protein